MREKDLELAVEILWKTAGGWESKAASCFGMVLLLGFEKEYELMNDAVTLMLVANTRHYLELVPELRAVS